MSTFTAATCLDRTATDVADAGVLSPRSSFWAAFVLLALIVGGIGGGTYVSARRVVMDGVHGSLESIARIKAEQVQRWLGAARRESGLALNAPLFVDELERWLAAGMPSDARRVRLLEHLQATVATGRLRDVDVRSPDDGRVLLSTAAIATNDAVHRASAVQAAATQRAVLQDFHSSEHGRIGVDLGYYTPIGGAADARPVAVATLELDPAVGLLPFLNRWPGTSPTAETLLFRVDGKEIVYLNHSRHRDVPLLTMRREIDEPTLLAAQVARGSVGAVGGVDYRGVESIGYALKVEGTPWYLISKMDRSEALAGLDGKALFAAVALTCLLALFAAWKIERSGRIDVAHRVSFERALLMQRLEFLARHANDGIVLADTAGRILEVNPRCSAIYGYGRDELLGMTLTQFWGEAASIYGVEAIREAVHRRKDGAAVAVEISARLIDIDGTQYLQALVRDVTERRRTADELRRSEERARRYAGELEDLYQNAPCGYHSVDAEGVVWRINDTELRWLGYAREEVVGRMRLTDMLDEASRARFHAHFETFKREGTLSDLEMVFLRKDGVPLQVMVSATAIYDGDGNFVASRTTVVDVSHLQALQDERACHARRLEALSRHLIAVQEEERRRLSCELHDRAAPNLAALKLTIDTLVQGLSVPHSADVEDSLADAHAIIDDTVAGVREVCTDLRPSLLDYAGLVSALVGYTQQYTRRTGIPVCLRMPPDETRFGAEAESILFRIVQEALANVARHAQASRVDVALECDRALTRLTVSDDGVGFELASVRAAGPGIRSMRERAEFAGGKFRCVSWPGKGTDIRVEVKTPRSVADSPRYRLAANDAAVPAH